MSDLSTFIKTYKAQDSVRRYGLDDIQLEFDKDIDFPYYGLVFASKKDFGNGVYEYVSYLKEDSKLADFHSTLAFKMLTNPKVKIATKITEEDNNKIEVYSLLYYNPNSGIFKPTILAPVNNNEDIETKIVYEFLFAFDGGWIFPLEHIAMTGGKDFFPTLDFWKDDLRDLDEDSFFLFANSPSCTLDRENDKITLEVSNLNGEFSSLTYDTYTKQDIANALVSVRITELYQRKAYSNDEWVEIKETYPFIP